MKIVWKVNASLSVQGVTWTLLSQDGSFAQIGLAGVTKNTKYSPGPFTIQRPYTLILENVNMQYNGTYRCEILVAGGQYHSSDVTVIIVGKCLLFYYVLVGYVSTFISHYLTIGSLA